MLMSLVDGQILYLTTVNRSAHPFGTPMRLSGSGKLSFFALASPVAASSSFFLGPRCFGPVDRNRPKRDKSLLVCLMGYVWFGHGLSSFFLKKLE